MLIDSLAGLEPVKAQIVRYAESDRLQTSAVTCFELLSGAGEGKRGDAVRRLLAGISIVPLDRESAERAGQTIGMGDSLIAGIALAHALPLFTRNRKHFQRVADLRLVELEERS